MKILNFLSVQYLPSWMPGAQFKRQAAIWHKWVMDMTIVPYAAVKRDIVCILPTQPEPLLIAYFTGTRHGVRIRCFYLDNCTG